MYYNTVCCSSLICIMHTTSTGLHSHIGMHVQLDTTVGTRVTAAIVLHSSIHDCIYVLYILTDFCTQRVLSVDMS